MGEGGREGWGSGGDGNMGVERGIWGEMGIWVGETVMWRVMERGILGVGIFAYFPKQGEL